jgi:hypothetical protein
VGYETATQLSSYSSNYRSPRSRVEGLKLVNDEIDRLRALTLALRERGFDLTEPPAVEPDLPWVAVAPKDIRTISGAAEHAQILEKALEEATKYVLIHSAFLNGTRAEQLAKPIGLALQRGVDVIVARGGSEESTEGEES